MIFLNAPALIIYLVRAFARIGKMAIKKSDYLYLLIIVILCSVAVVAFSQSNHTTSLYATLGVVGLMMVLAIIIRPSLGASILIIAVYTNISALLTDHGYIGIIKPLVAVIFIAIIVRNYYTGDLPKRHNKIGRIEFFLILYLVFVTSSYMVADNKDRALTAIVDLVKDIGIIYTILFSLRNPEDWKQSIWVLIITTVVLSMLGLYQVFTGNYFQVFFGLASNNLDVNNHRISGPVGDPNMWGQILVAVIPLVFFRFVHDPNRNTKLISAAFVVILLFETINTFSRGAFLALLVTALLVIFVFNKNIKVAMVFVAIGIFIIAIPFIPSSYTNRFLTLARLSPTAQYGIYQDSSFRGRSSELLAGLSMFAAHPLLGVGVGNYFNNYQIYSQEIGIEVRSEERDAHSLYVEIFSETGILGIFAFGGLVFSLFAGISKAAKSLVKFPQYHSWIPWFDALQVALVGYLVAAIFLHGAYIRYFWILVALSMTAIQLADEINHNHRQSLTREPQN